MFETNIELVQFLLSILVWCTCILDDNLLQYSVKNYEGNIYNNTLNMILSGALSIYLSFWLISHFHPALALTFSFMLMIVAGFIYP